MLMLFEHGRFVDVIVGCDAMIVRIFGQHLHVCEIVAADVDIEKDEVVVDVPGA
jgi:hypothetical protein